MNIFKLKTLFRVILIFVIFPAVLIGMYLLNRNEQINGIAFQFLAVVWTIIVAILNSRLKPKGKTGKWDLEL